MTTATVIPLGVKQRRRKVLEPFTVPHFSEYCRRLVMDDGHRHPPEPWQLDFAAEVFRLLRLYDGGGVGEAWQLVPEGNGKTTFTAELAVYGADWARAPWIPVGASTREQAKTLYSQAAGFIRNTPGMERRFKLLDGRLTVRPLDPRTGRLRPGRGIEITPFDPDSNDGVIPFPFFICDELHRHPDMSLWRLWKGKARKRHAVGIGISTAGEPGSEFEEARDNVRQSCRRVRRAHGGTLYRGNRMSMWEFKLDDPRDVLNPKAVAAVNPLSTITEEVIQEELESPTLDEGHFKRVKCNIAARSAHAAITDEEWQNARIDYDCIPPGVRIDAGLDLGWKQDTTALVSEWTAEDFKLLDEAELAVPPRNGTQLHPDEVKRLLIARHERNPIDTLVMDMSQGADIAAWAADELDVTVVDRTQSNDLAVEDYKHFMADLRADAPWDEPILNKQGKKVGTVRRKPLRIVRVCPLLTRHSMNAIGRRLPRGDLRFDRPTSDRHTPGKQDVRVIDALTAGSMVNTHTNTLAPRGFDIGAFRIQAV